MAEEKHFYGGQAIMEGVMMRGTDSWGAAVQRKDGTVGVISQKIWDLTHRYAWAKWPLIRGSIALIDTLFLGIRSLMFSYNVLVEEQLEQDRRAAEQAAADSAGAEPEATGKRKKKAPKKQSDMGWAVWLAMLPSFAIGIGLFVILPTLAVGWVPTEFLHGHSQMVQSILKNLIEGVVRLVVILGYISVISLLPDIKRLFQFHGAEHATINCYEAGEPITLETCRRYGPLHPRCGTAFLLVFIVVKIIVGAFFGWPAPWLRMLLRLVMVPVVAAVAYEIIRYGGRHRDSLPARIMAQPGLLMQRLTTRQPNDEQIKVAIYALASVAPEVPLPVEFTPPVPAAMDGKLATEGPEDGRTAGREEESAAVES